MSVDNSELLMLLGGKKKAEQTIGIAGQKGFGVGVYGGDPSDLTAMGLAPMEGCENPNNKNYGNYIHTNGSVMVFIPAFCYRVGRDSAPNYSAYLSDSLEIRDALEMGMEVGSNDYDWTPPNGFVLHRAFIDGGVLKRGFFIDKYLCSLNADRTLLVSVQGVVPTSLSEFGSAYISGCTGQAADGIILGRARGDAYSCVTAFQWGAISMLSLAHGQAADSSQYCGWFDNTRTTNYPKGNNNYKADIDDTTLSWPGDMNIVPAGTCSRVEKTTHNGQANGVTDVNGTMEIVILGIRNPTQHALYLFADTVRAHSVSLENYLDNRHYMSMYYDYGDGEFFWDNNCLSGEANGYKRALCGVVPQNAASSPTLSKFGGDLLKLDYQPQSVCVACGSWSDTTEAGIWYRLFTKLNNGTGNTALGFRAAGYAN